VKNTNWKLFKRSQHHATWRLNESKLLSVLGKYLQNWAASTSKLKAKEWDGVWGSLRLATSRRQIFNKYSRTTSTHRNARRLRQSKIFNRPYINQKRKIQNNLSPRSKFNIQGTMQNPQIFIDYRPKGHLNKLAKFKSFSALMQTQHKTPIRRLHQDPSKRYDLQA